MEKQRQVVIIAGPTGCGESTITKEILSRFPNTTRLVTATTRPPRSGEELNKDYYFFTEQEFKEKEAQGEILESTYNEPRGVYYGTYAPDLNGKIAAGKIVIVNPDIVGAKYYKEHNDAVTIFIKAENIDVLVERIRARNPEMSEEELALRRQNAEAEIRDEEPYYDYVVLNRNGGLDEAVNEVVSILKTEGYNLR